MTVVANAWVEIAPSMKGFNNKVASELRGIAPLGDKVGKGFSSRFTGIVSKTMKAGMAGAGVAAGGVFAGALAKGMGRLNAIDQASAKLDALGNSGTQVKSIMNNALASVKGTAFGLGEAAGTAATMVASGIKPGEQLESVLKGVADSASIAEVGMGEMGLIWGKVAAKGKLDGETLAQMLERQLPIYDILAKKTGHTSDEVSEMVSKGKIDFETFAAAMNDYVGGGAERMGQTVQGALQNVGASLGRFGAALTGPVFAAAPALISSTISVFDAMTDAIGPAASRIGELLTPALENVASLIKERLAPAMGEAVAKVGDLAVRFAEFVVDPGVWEHLGEVFATVKDTVERLWPTVESLAGSLLTVGQSISVATWTAFSSVLNALAPLVESVLVPLVEQVAAFAEQNPGAVQAIVTAFLGFKAVGAIAGPVGTATATLKNMGGAVEFAAGAFKGAGLAGGLVNIATTATSANPIIFALGKAVVGMAQGLGTAGRAVGGFLTVVKTVGGVLKTVLGFFNPWVLGITAVVGVLTWFFTQTETGQAMWASFTQSLAAGWDFVTSKFQAGIEWITNAFTGIKALLFDRDYTFEFGQAFGIDEDSDVVAKLFAIRDGFVAFKDDVVLVVTLLKDQVVDHFTTMWELIKVPFTTGMEILKDLVAGGFQILKAVFTGDWGSIGDIVAATWETIKGHIGEGVGRAIELIMGFASRTFQRFVEWKDEVLAPVAELWAQVKAKIADFVRDAIEQIVVMAARTVATIIQWKNDMLAKAVAMIVEFMAEMRALPDKVKSVFANAGQWLVDAGRNIISGLLDGLKSMWASVESWFSEKTASIRNFFSGADAASSQRIGYVGGHHDGGVAGFASGGLLPYVPGVSRTARDPLLAYSVEVGQPIARVEPGEFVVNRAMTRRFLPLLEAINGGRLTGAQGDLGLPGFAEGGQVGGKNKRVTAQQLLDFARGKSVHGFQAARPLEGAPYVFGGHNWGDCSSSMGMLAELAGGLDPLAGGRYMATMNEASQLGAAGFSRGRSGGKNAFEVGFFNGGPWGGHTSGTIFDAAGKGINVEMGGGRGNGQIGGPAAGARHSQYSDIFHIPLGGSGKNIDDIDSTSTDGISASGSEDGKRFENEKIDWGTAQSLADEWDKRNRRNNALLKYSAGIFDTGGILPTNGIAINKGAPERVLPPGLTRAFDRFVAMTPRLAGAMEEFVIAWRGGDWGYGSTAEIVGDTIAKRLVNAAGFAGAQYRDISAGASIRAYLQNMTAGEGLKLADSVGQIFGINGIASTFGGVVDAWDGLQDAAVGQVDAADAVKQAERNLAKARAEGSPDDVAAAEADLAKAHGAVKMAAMATGQAQIAMMLEVVKLAIEIPKKIIGWINGKIQDVLKGVATAWQGISEAYGSMGKLAEVVAKLRNDVVGLSLDQAMAQIELAAAFREVRIAHWDGVNAQLEGVVKAAQAQAAFEAQRKADMRLAALAYDDLSLAFDRFRWGMIGANQDALDAMAQWSDKSHELFEAWRAEQVNLQLLEKQAQAANLESLYKATVAALDLRDVTANLENAAKKLAIASGQTFGLDNIEATVKKRYADLVAEKAQAQAELSDIRNLFNANLKRQTRRRISQIDAELAELEARPEFGEDGRAAKREIEGLLSSARGMAFWGTGDKIATLIKNSALGDAERALGKIEFENHLVDLKAEQDNLRAKLERNMAELEHREKLDPLKTMISGLEAEKASHLSLAEYWRTNPDDGGVRAALAELAKSQADTAAELKNLAGKSTAVTLVGESFTREQVMGLIKHLGGRVDRLENPPAAGATVAAQVRG
ncbi:tape measure protein [Corynebacterium lizhenjunii]|uniref:Tape measure protein n=1 Tax=Corynebacterium lizhenjunii TaxID=2709394 RepID=A0A7T0KCJ1_9CORY|nr:tape measure protein [Corynebacterium lizhenjunii]QPK78261.1 tape measure protein [Corynebacterium lizhenjunii]